MFNFLIKIIEKNNQFQISWLYECLYIMPYLSESVLDDGCQLLVAVGWEVKQLRSAVRLSLQSGQNAVRQVEGVCDT